MKSKLLIGGLGISLLMSTLPPVTANALTVVLPPSESESIIRPMLTYIAKASCNLTIDSSGTAHVESSVIAYSNVTTVKISAKLQQYKNNSWVTLETFSASDNSDFVLLYETKSVSKGYKYRVTATVTAYSSGNGNETLSLKSGETAY